MMAGRYLPRSGLLELYVLIGPGNVKSVKRILKGGRFDFELPWSLANLKITLRVIYPEGYVSLIDKSFVPITKFLPDRDMKVISEVIVLSTVEDRFNAERDLVTEALQSKKCVDVFQKIETMYTEFYKPQSLFLFTVAKLWADALHNAGEFQCPVQDWEIAQILRFQQSEFPAFDDLSGARQFNIFAQYARALHKLKKPERQLVSGPLSEWVEGTSFSLDNLTVADVAVHCYRKALKLRTKKEHIADNSWRLLNGLIEMLYSVKRHGEVMTEIYEYLVGNEYPRAPLSDSQQEGVIRLLSTYKDSLAIYSNRLSWREAGYIRYAASTPKIRTRWVKFEELLERWDYLYTPNPETNTGLALRSHLELAKEILHESKKALNIN